MPQTMQGLMQQYVSNVRAIYGSHLRQIILYGSYARGDYNSDSDVDIMILLDLSDMDIKGYRHQLSDMTFDFNMDHDMDIKPITAPRPLGGEPCIYLLIPSPFAYPPGRIAAGAGYPGCARRCAPPAPWPR